MCSCVGVINNWLEANRSINYSKIITTLTRISFHSQCRNRTLSHVVTIITDILLNVIINPIQAALSTTSNCYVSKLDIEIFRCDNQKSYTNYIRPILSLVCSKTNRITSFCCKWSLGRYTNRQLIGSKIY